MLNESFDYFIIQPLNLSKIFLLIIFLLNKTLDQVVLVEFSPLLTILQPSSPLSPPSELWSELHPSESCTTDSAVFVGLPLLKKMTENIIKIYWQNVCIFLQAYKYFGLGELKHNSLCEVTCIHHYKIIYNVHTIWLGFLQLFHFLVCVTSPVIYIE